MHTFYYQLPGEPNEFGPLKAKNKREALAKIREKHNITMRGLKVRRVNVEKGKNGEAN
jgi:hypothetical protein